MKMNFDFEGQKESRQKSHTKKKQEFANRDIEKRKAKAGFKNYLREIREQELEDEMNDIDE